MYCMKCGTKNLDDAKFCVNCGTPFVDDNNDIFAKMKPTKVVDTLSKNKATTALTLGIISASLSIVCCCIPYLTPVGSISCGIIALAFGIKTIKSEYRNKAIWAIVLGIIGILIGSLELVINLLATFSTEYQEWFQEYYDEIIDSLPPEFQV